MISSDLRDIITKSLEDLLPIMVVKITRQASDLMQENKGFPTSDVVVEVSSATTNPSNVPTSFRNPEVTVRSGTRVPSLNDNIRVLPISSGTSSGDMFPRVPVTEDQPMETTMEIGTRVPATAPLLLDNGLQVVRVTAISSGDVPSTDEIARVPSDHMNPSLSTITSSSNVIRNQVSDYQSVAEDVLVVNGATTTSFAPLSHNTNARNEDPVSINPNVGLSSVVDNDVRMPAANHEGARARRATVLPVVGGRAVQQLVSQWREMLPVDGFFG
ncbi:hypothetical protein NE237_029550 [Protea cynaroides]|uniref:Uncharacterized protein n=1 Tax=Protea cynaroides TaxID=273540 RepID=A0A9Q0GU40_9MAGN|nr:hypothetical protein NE237_029550 [Protea cynaroides]